MEIVIQQNASEKTQMDKAITDIITLSGYLRNESSIVNPVIRIEGNISDISLCNYFTIPEFNRSYFLTDAVSLRTGLYELHGHCDVISSFKSGIRSNTGIVRRSENNWNLYLDDGSLRVYNNPHINTKFFPSGFSGQCYVLAIAGSAQATDNTLSTEGVQQNERQLEELT